MSKYRTLPKTLLLGCCVAAILGCSDTVELGKVTGAVTLDGKPIGEVRVLFVPVPGDGGEGVYSDCFTGEDGKYDLIYSGIAEEVVHGAILGQHTVAVEDSKAEESRGAIAIRIPDRYSSGARSPLKYEVKSGEQTYDIELKSR